MGADGRNPVTAPNAPISSLPAPLWGKTGKPAVVQGDEEEEVMVSGKRGWEDDGTYQTWQHLLEGAVQKHVCDLGQHAGQRNMAGTPQQGTLQQGHRSRDSHHAHSNHY